MTHTRPQTGELHPGLPERLRESIHQSGKTAKLVCDEADISTTTLHRYINENVSPSLANLQALAESTGVDFLWLATGEGDIQVFNNNQRQQLRIRDLVIDGMLQIEAAEHAQNKRISLKTRANILSDLVTDALQEGEREVNSGNVIRFMRYAGS